MQEDLFFKPTKVTLEIKLPPLANGGKPTIERRLPPSFKNSKMLIVKNPRGRPLRRPMLITKPEYQELMEAIIQSFVFQLRSAFRGTDGKILTGSSLRALIALSMPEDDALPYLTGGISIRPRRVPKGEEGVTITVERIG